LPNQLNDWQSGAALGLRVLGAVSHECVRAIFHRFSTARQFYRWPGAIGPTLKNDDFDPLCLRLPVEAMMRPSSISRVAAKPARINDTPFSLCPHDRLRDVLGKYNRLVGKGAVKTQRDSH